MKEEDKISLILNSALWRCGDCGNLYSRDVEFCPNGESVDEWVVKKVIKRKDLEHIHE
jgi:RNA polymerase subunit RPABC4/transcription elongation factor Spt4